MTKHNLACEKRPVVKGIGRVFLLILCISLMGFLISCGKKPSVEVKKVKIRYSNAESLPELVKRHKAIVDRFNETHPDIEVVYEVTHGAAQKILIEIAGGSAPDVFFWWEHLLGPVVEKGSIIDLSPYIKEIDLNNYFPVFANWQNNGKLYGFPYIWGPMVLFYNKDLFDKAGLKYPDKDWTWNDYLESAKKLTIRSEDKRITQYGAAALDDAFATQVLCSFGGNFFNKSITNSIIDSPEAREAFNFMVDLQVKHKVVPNPQDMSELTWGNREMFEAGKIAMHITMLNVLEGFKKHIKDFSWDVAPVPFKKDKDRVVLGGSSALCISAQSKHPEESWEFIKFACGYEGGKILAEYGGLPPHKKAFLEVVSPPPEHIAEVCIEQMEYFTSFSSSFKKTWAGEFETRIMHAELEKLFLGLQGVEQTIMNIKRESEKLLKEK